MKNDTSLGSVITEGFSSSLAELYNIMHQKYI